jgi:hypothetical protein
VNADFAQQKEHAHELVDRLGPEKLAALVDLLEEMLAPNGGAITNASFDDEEETLDERHAVAASKEWFRSNPKGIPFEQAVADLGLTMDEIRSHKDPG